MIRFLTEKQAINRAKSVLPGIHYKMYLNLNKGKSFNGMNDIEFELKDKENVFLDFAGKELSEISVNGQKLSDKERDECWKDGFINLPKNLLNIGKNNLNIRFNNDYNTDGNGLHTYTDIDGKQYIYVQSEPYWINRVYPVFDQPDLKAYMSFYINAPEDWTVISNENWDIKQALTNGAQAIDEKNDEFLSTILKDYKDDLADKTKVFHRFITTPLLPTYLHGITAGPFRSIELKDHQDTVPMTIYCRESLYHFAIEQQEDMFNFAIHCIKFFNKFFNVTYPFSKNDFVFCPEYTSGAMEYPGVVTYNDSLIFREKVNNVQKSFRSEYINHELAHMWFGNYVTMKWWNDLWLNEAFAEFACFLCNYEIRDKMGFETTDAWSSFCINKNSGYGEDQMKTTHPIACCVNATNNADSIFDGITYNKGAAVLKQLYFLIGKDNFSKNIGNYFNKYKWSNTTLDNFIEELDNFEPEDKHEAYNIIKWQEDWIQKAGLNAVEVEWDYTKQGEIEVKLKQTAVLEEFPTLRYHKIELAFFDEKGKVADVKELIIENKPETIVKIENKGYKAVLPNYNDWSFIKIILDDQSLDFFKANLGNLDEGLTQLIIVRSLFEMVRDAKVKATDFVDMLLSGYIAQTFKNIHTFGSVMRSVQGAVFTYLPKQQRLETASKVFKALNELNTDNIEFGQKQTLLKQLVSFGINADDIEVLRQILDKNLENDDKTMGNQLKWKIVMKLNGSKKYTEEEKLKYIEAIKAIDKTDSVKEYELRITNMKYSMEKRKEVWKEYTDINTKLSHVELIDIFVGFFSVHVDEELKLPFQKEILDNLDQICKTRSKVLGEVFIDYALPDNDDLESFITGLNSTLSKLTENEEHFANTLRKEVESSQRRLQAFQLFK